MVGPCVLTGSLRLEAHSRQSYMVHVTLQGPPLQPGLPAQVVSGRAHGIGWGEEEHRATGRMCRACAVGTWGLWLSQHYWSPFRPEGISLISVMNVCPDCCPCVCVNVCNAVLRLVRPERALLQAAQPYGLMAADRVGRDRLSDSPVDTIRVSLSSRSAACLPLPLFAINHIILLIVCLSPSFHPHHLCYCLRGPVRLARVSSASACHPPTYPTD